ncbi:MAG: OmpA family protein [Rhodobacteraceae bacterium]|nr:OmpA family protein [Paracoccaceae bacterium]
MHIPSVSAFRSLLAAITLLSGIAAGQPGPAQDNPFAPGWTLDPAASYIRFGSVKNEKGQVIAETHSFATFEGRIGADGALSIKVKLDSVDTKNDLRNVRMRFLFFETFKYPEAEVTAQLTPDMAAGLSAGGQKAVTIPFTFAIHGARNEMTTSAIVAAETPDRIVATSSQPVLFKVEEFGLEGNLRKIAETAGGFDITPQMDISYQFTFNRTGGGGGEVTADAGTAAEPARPEEPPAAAALETKGEFSYEECVGRFEILSETGNIYFASGSAQLTPDSAYVLATITDIVKRCPGLRILISGHTDDVGSDAMNQALSERRAQAVVKYLTGQGIEPGRLFATGYGESRPMVPNDSDFNRGRNRRIEFSLYK